MFQGSKKRRFGEAAICLGMYGGTIAVQSDRPLWCTNALKAVGELPELAIQLRVSSSELQLQECQGSPVKDG